ncbi:ATP-binding protein [Streptomyces sp. ISL-99]|uniref:ATP-binding protein n=1 Tax=Streptomyces sp. ISL-99 TaxID=2819193 RepID=UPI001BE576D6|nr:ATP-binding protein [Streptomyces sp. ISL-99]MBT2525275.1 ATP-binding protein [Streptomyces sp. ISL-99]
MATVNPSWAYTLHLPHDPRAPGIARATLRAVLATYELGELTDTAELLASELVTNAQRHTDSPYSFRLRPVGPDRLRLAVWDADPFLPPSFTGTASSEMAALADDTAEEGRGLHLVQACADRWGGYAFGSAYYPGRPGGGKLLWAECGRKARETW